MQTVINEESDCDEHHPHIGVVGLAFNEPAVLHTEAKSVHQNANEGDHTVGAQFFNVDLDVRGDIDCQLGFNFFL